MATDPASDRIVLHGGYDGNVLTDTWTWDGDSWLKVSEAGPAGFGFAFDPHSQGVLLRSYLDNDGAWRCWSFANGHWTLLREEPYPTPRARMRLVRRSATAETLFIGGETRFFGDWIPETWRLAAGAWSLADTATPQFAWGAFAYDPGADRVIGYSSILNGLWEWAEDSWVYLERPPFGQRLDGAGFVFDTAHREFVLFGGGWLGIWSDAQWMWNGTAWREYRGPRPSPREHHAMTYDAARERIVLFGGFGEVDPDHRYVYFDDTWEWDGEQWHRLDVAGPSSRAGAAMCYDPVNERVLLHGGTFWDFDSNWPTGYADSWAWDGVAWTELSAGETPEALEPAMVFDERLQGMVRLTETVEHDGAPSMYQLAPARMPEIVAQPQSREDAEGAFASFFVGGEAHSSLAYVWRKDGMPLADDGRVVGAAARTLSIEPVRPQDAGVYDVIISNTCGSATSDPATLTVLPRCTPDIDGDGEVDTADVAAFLDAWAARRPESDFNADGMIDSRDVIAFLHTWAFGCP
jgi:hypothetical protein